MKALLATLALAATPPSAPTETVLVAFSGTGDRSVRREALVGQIRAVIERASGLSNLSKAATKAALQARSEAAAPLPRRKIRRQIRRARAAFSEFALDRAERAVADALQALGDHRGRVEARKLEQALYALSVSLAHAKRDVAGMDAALLAYALRFRAPPRGNAWPPDLVEKLDDLHRAAQGRLTVRTRPLAEVILDGRLAGRTPLDLTDMVAGDHRVRVRAEGFISASRTVQVRDRERALLEIDLKRDMVASLRALDPSEDLPDGLREALVAMGQEHGFQQVILTGPRELAAGVALRWIVLSGRAGDRTLTAPSASAAAQALEALVDGLRVHPTPPEPTPATSPMPWWAWAGLGTGVAMAGAGAALRIAAEGTSRELDTRADSLTQVEAFEIRDRGVRELVSGGVLLGASAAVLSSITGWYAYQRWWSEPSP